MTELSGLVHSLFIASAMVALTVLIHFWGLIGLTRLLGHTGPRLNARESPAGQAAIIVMVVFGIFAVHTIEIWLYAAAYQGLGQFTSFEAALYFSTVSFVSLGFGDIVLAPPWRIISAIEAANGVILFAWSTAFMFTLTARLRALEHGWLDRPHSEDERPDG